VEIILFQTLAHKKNVFEGVYLLGVFSLVAGIWCASESKIIQFFIPNPLLNFNIALVSIFLLPIPLLQFIVQVYSPRDSGILIIFKNVFSIFFILACILHITGLLSFIMSVIGYHLLIIVASMAVLVISVKELKTGNNSIKLFFIGCILFVGFILADLLKFYFSDVPWSDAQFFTQFGTLIFTMLMTASLGKFILGMYEKEAKNEIYERLAYTDILTGLKNRTSFEEEIQKRNLAPEAQTDTSIIIFDLNNLKDTNDTLGHKEGDQLIRNGAGLIEDTFKGHGEIYRIGGDEFVVLSEGYPEASLRDLLGTFSEKLDAFNHNDSNLKVGIAWGMASFKKSEDHDLYSVFVRADKSMYECKKIQKHLPA
jgi:diguanylate cyclase (GGDEF)-like protein